jgi:hypothetical protein
MAITLHGIPPHFTMIALLMHRVWWEHLEKQQ